MHGANYSSDHIMVKSSTQMEIRRKITERRTVMKKLCVEQLKQKPARDDLIAALADKFDQPPCGSSEECLDKLKIAVYDTANEQLRFSTKRHEFDENDEEFRESH